MSALRIVVNQSYRGQRITGQQRYANEISARLVGDSGFAEAAPEGFWARSTARVWLWVQLALPVMARASVLLSMTSRAPVWSRRQVLVVHDLFVLEHPEWFSRKYYWTHAPLLKAQIRTAAGIIAVSEPVAEQLRKLGRDDVEVAPNAPSEVFAEADVTPSTVLAELGLSAGACFVAVGSRDPRKNLTGLARGYAELSDEERAKHPLLLVGGGASIFRDELIDWPSGTHEVGYVDDDELRRLYRDAASVVFVSLAEGFGLPLVEAAASGARSMTISDIDVFRWVCGDDGARYVDPSDPQSIATGLRAEITHPTAPRIAPDRFTWSSSAGTVAAVCERAGGPR